MILLYDGSFYGLFSVIFYIYSTKVEPLRIVAENKYSEAMFQEKTFVHTEPEKSERVLNALKAKISREAFAMLFRVYLSELPDTEKLILNYSRIVFNSRFSPERDFSNNIILDVKQIALKVSREAHRMQGFIRFQQLKDETWFSSIDPKYNILPIVVRHFKDRFGLQKWIIYDTTRKYGCYYDLKSIHEVTFDDIKLVNGKIPSVLLHFEEEAYQQLWKDYFKSVNIKERKNLRLQMQLLPKRFWKYLIEKQA